MTAQKIFIHLYLGNLENVVETLGDGLKPCVILFNMGGCHTIYTRNNMGQKCEGNCGLWVLNEVIKKNIS